jgi:uncharacterized membrane protein
MPKSRLEAFSDCIIAFAVTLLIYDFHLQDLDSEVSNGRMIQALLTLGPNFCIYVISFLVCSVWWVGHHALIHDLERVDSKLLWLNSLFLMWIAILPFPTGVLGHHPTQSVAIVLYGVVCILACGSFLALRWYASFPGRFMKNEIPEKTLRRELRMSLLFTSLYIAAALVGSFYPLAGLISYAAIPGSYTAISLFKANSA